MKNKYYQLSRYENKAVINIFGDIVDDIYDEGVSALQFAYELEQVGDVDAIDVYINSYGGSVSQGFAIYNQLKNHPAKVTTVCSGFACSIASIIFLAGDERIMQDASLLMIHNPFCMTMGNANELRKQADDLDKMAQVSVDIYCEVTGLDEKTIKDMMDKETWITSKEACELGFATNQVKEEEFNEEVSLVVQSVKRSLIDKIMGTETPKQQETPSNINEETPSNNALTNFIKIFK